VPPATQCGPLRSLAPRRASASLQAGSRPCFADWTAPGLNTSCSREHVQGLPQRVGVPGGPCPGFEGHPRSSDPCRTRSLDNGILPEEPLRRLV
jgi:hypothetical protein